MSLESVVFVDLDNNSINANIEDAAILPRAHVTALKESIEDALFNDVLSMFQNGYVINR